MSQADSFWRVDHSDRKSTSFSGFLSHSSFWESFQHGKNVLVVLSRFRTDWVWKEPTPVGSRQLSTAQAFPSSRCRGCQPPATWIDVFETAVTRMPESSEIGSQRAGSWCYGFSSMTAVGNESGIRLRLSTCECTRALRICLSYPPTKTAPPLLFSGQDAWSGLALAGPVATPLQVVPAALWHQGIQEIDCVSPAACSSACIDFPTHPEQWGPTPFRPCPLPVNRQSWFPPGAQRGCRVCTLVLWWSLSSCCQGLQGSVENPDWNRSTWIAEISQSRSWTTWKHVQHYHNAFKSQAPLEMAIMIWKCHGSLLVPNSFTVPEQIAHTRCNA